MAKDTQAALSKFGREWFMRSGSIVSQLIKEREQHEDFMRRLDIFLEREPNPEVKQRLQNMMQEPLAVNSAVDTFVDAVSHQENRTLRISLRSALDLKCVDTFSKSDPYANDVFIFYTSCVTRVGIMCAFNHSHHSK